MGITCEDDDIKEIPPSDKSLMVPEKHQWVGPDAAQNITQSITQSTSKVGEAAVLVAAELDLIQSCLGKPITPTDAEAEDSPMKVTTKRKKKHSKKKWDQSWDWQRQMLSESDSMTCHPAPQQNPPAPQQNPVAPTPTEAEPEGRSQIRESIWKQAIVETEHQRCRATDYFFIHNIQNQLGLPSKEVNQDDMSSFLHNINAKRQETWNEVDWHKSYNRPSRNLTRTCHPSSWRTSRVLLHNWKSVSTAIRCQWPVTWRGR